MIAKLPAHSVSPRADSKVVLSRPQKASVTAYILLLVADAGRDAEATELACIAQGRAPHVVLTPGRLGDEATDRRAVPADALDAVAAVGRAE